jgi:RimJ/RimL family protein N-acetyltransferase
VTLREFGERDVAEYVASFAADPDQGRRIGVPRDPVESEVLADLPRVAEDAARGEFLWLAACGAADELLGCVWVHHVVFKHRRLELGLLVLPQARGRGIGARAVDLACGWAFDELGFERVEMTTTPDNASLRAVAPKAGFVEEGIMRSRDVERGVRVDIVMLGRLRPE